MSLTTACLKRVTHELFNFSIIVDRVLRPLIFRRASYSGHNL